MDESPQVKRCGCRVVPPRTLTLVAGYLQLVFVVLAMIGFSLGVAVQSADLNTDAGYVIQGLLISCTIFFAIHVVTTILLLVGTHKDRSGFILAWLIFNVISTVIGIIFCIVGAVYLENHRGVVSMIMICFCYTVMMENFIRVVNSYYNSVKGNTSHPLSQA